MVTPIEKQARDRQCLLVLVTMNAYLARLLIHGLVGTHHSRARPQEHRTLRQGLPQTHRLGAWGSACCSPYFTDSLGSHMSGSQIAHAQVDGLLVCDHVKRKLG